MSETLTFTNQVERVEVDLPVIEEKKQHEALKRVVEGADYPLPPLAPGPDSQPPR